MTRAAIAVAALLALAAGCASTMTPEYATARRNAARERARRAGTWPTRYPQSNDVELANQRRRSSWVPMFEAIGHGLAAGCEWLKICH